MICLYCDEPLTANELKTQAGGKHVECFVRSALGSVAHQERRCVCFGGTVDDDEGLSRREAARAAYGHFKRSIGGKRR